MLNAKSVQRYYSTVQRRFTVFLIYLKLELLIGIVGTLVVRYVNDIRWQSKSRVLNAMVLLL